jgi:hypothetical protein
MFEDIIKPTKKKKTSKKINLIDKTTIYKVLLTDAQEVMWDLFKEPCYYCGRTSGQMHKLDCKFFVIMDKINKLLGK